MADLCGGPCRGLVLPLAGCHCSSCSLQLVLACGQVSLGGCRVPVSRNSPVHLIAVAQPESNNCTDGAWAGGNLKEREPLLSL